MARPKKEPTVRVVVWLPVSAMDFWARRAENLGIPPRQLIQMKLVESAMASRVPEALTPKPSPVVDHKEKAKVTVGKDKCEHPMFRRSKGSCLECGEKVK